MLAKIRLYLLRLGFRLWVSTGLYYLWSRVFRYLFEARPPLPMPIYGNLESLEHDLGRMVYSPDPLRGLLDYFSYPETVAYRFTMGQPIGDCDEYAVYACTALLRMGKTAHILTVTWLDSVGKFHGHNLCVFKDAIGWSHIGNWYKGKAQGSFKNPEVIARYIASGGSLIGYQVVTHDLRRVTEW